MVNTGSCIVKRVVTKSFTNLVIPCAFVYRRAARTSGASAASSRPLYSLVCYSSASRALALSRACTASKHLQFCRRRQIASLSTIKSDVFGRLHHLKNNNNKTRSVSEVSASSQQSSHRHLKTVVFDNVLS